MSKRTPHKISRHIFAVLGIVLFSCIFITHNSPAYEAIIDPAYAITHDSKTGIVEQFMRQGMNCYQKNDLQGAIDHFARALLLDPSNKMARERMALITAQTSLPAAQRIQLFLSEDLLVFNENLRAKLNYITAKRDALIATLLRKNYPQALIDQNFRAIRGHLFYQGNTRNEGAVSIHPLAMLNKSLMREQERLSRELLNIHKQIAWLQGPLKSEIQTANHVRTNNPGGPWQQIAGVREELNELRLQVQNLQNDVKHKDDRITILTKQVIEFSLKLTEREMILNEKINALDSLHDAYTDLQSRQELGQKIFEEKNVQIRSLQEGLAALQADTAVHTKEINSLIAAKDQALDQWEKILAIYQGKLKDATRIIEARDNALNALQEQLTSLNTKLFEKETTLEKTKEKLASLEKQFEAVVSNPK